MSIESFLENLKKSYGNKYNIDKLIEEKKLSEIEELYIQDNYLERINYSNIKTFEDIEFMIEHKCDINTHPGNGFSLLQRLCCNYTDKPVELIKLAIKNTKDLNYKNKEGYTALTYACQNQDSIEIFKHLIENKADINLSTLSGDTPIHIMLKSHYFNFENLKFLVENKADTNKLDADNTLPLFYAVEKHYNNDEIISFLLELTDDVNVKDKERFGDAPTHKYFGFADSLDLVKKFVEKKADLNLKNEEGVSPFFNFLDQSDPNIEILKYLLDHNADPNTKTEDDKPVLLKIAKSGYLSVDSLKILVESKCDINVLDGKKNNLLHIYCSKKPKKQFEIIKFLIEKKVDINSENQKKHTPLHLLSASEYSSMNLFKFFLESKSSVNAKDKDGKVPLHILGENDLDPVYKEDLLKLFVENGADLNVKDDEGNSPDLGLNK
eukprot:TRINITY_DN15086_c0_g1_i1.p1 TRINITY_DN15086_c0_g1~~TRINITY_DN15086_c0_g1_i1.p1  ORF type:complete len:438 (+),score=129.98 TRINITY_DN15086_c0_g1_i1:19-1332(+)